jgi:hypothetical protein
MEVVAERVAETDREHLGADRVGPVVPGIGHLGRGRRGSVGVDTDDLSRERIDVLRAECERVRECGRGTIAVAEEQRAVGGEADRSRRVSAPVREHVVDQDHFAAREHHVFVRGIRGHAREPGDLGTQIVRILVALVDVREVDVAVRLEIGIDSQA